MEPLGNGRHRWANSRRRESGSKEVNWASAALDVFANRAAGETEQVVRRNYQPLSRSSSASWKYPLFPWRTRWNAPVIACELQPLGVRRLFAWAIALVVVQRGLHMVSDAKAAVRCRGGTTLYAFPFLSATKLPFALARYFQIRKLVYNAFHSMTSRFRLARRIRGRAIRQIFPLFCRRQFL
jgi:hypothetical protein